jgi:uncharacterized phage infection (PIP) family protein YhgE
MAQEVDGGGNRRPEFEVTSSNPVQPRPEEDEAGSFLERETLRRKRMLRFYLALLAVPVALGIAVLVFGRSDRRLVLEEIKTQAPPIVKDAVGEQIAPTVKSEVQNQFAPTLEQIAGLQTQQAEVKNQLDAAQQQVAGVGQQQNQIASSLTATQQETAALRKESQSLKTQVDAVAGSVKTSQETTDQLRRESESLKTEVRTQIRALDTGVSEKLRRLDGLDEKLNRLDDINKRLVQFEKQSVEERVRRLEKQVDALSVRVIQLSDGQRPRRQPQPEPQKTPQ